MQQTIAIPSPARADTETVITALETAAAFRSKGDGREAMRWLRRAAESAGEAGDDERALSLSRIVADLHEELEAAPEPVPVPVPEQKVTPSPPPPPLPLPPPSSHAAAPTSSSPHTSYPPPPSSRSARPAPAVAPFEPHAATGLRHAARVQVAISTTKAGFLEVRPLAEGESARVGSSEAFLVMLDPTSTLLSR